MRISPCGRYYIHGFPSERGPDNQTFRTEIEEARMRIQRVIERQNLTEHQPDSSYDVYTGNMGLPFVRFLLDESQDHPLTPSRSSRIVKHCPFPASSMFVAISRGDLGLLADYGRAAHALPTSHCELLNGRAGCLHGLLLAQRLHPYLDLSSLIEILMRDILQGGDQDGDRPLMWEWRQKEYLGALHGVAGILFILSCAPSIQIPGLRDRIRFSIDCILAKYTLPSGNIQSSTDNEVDKLVHFCHGATGWIPILCRMSYLSHAERMGDVVWERGLLASKGPGICHGVAGSICGLLDLYSYTGNEIWLNRAKWFALFLAEHWCELVNRADHPLSLFEGVCGTNYALSIVMEPVATRTSWFPGLGI